MKAKLIPCLALVAFSVSALARGVRIWSEAELMKASDLVVIAQPISTKALDETNLLGYSSTKSFRSRFRGVETMFKVLDVFKGMPRNDRIVLHHYREELEWYREELEWGCPPNGPSFISFKAGTTNQYLLYLVKDGPNRYAPVTGQIDPELSVKSATDLPVGLRFSFPHRPPIADINPSICQPISVRVPTKLKVERTVDWLSVGIDTNSFVSTNLMVGTNMVTGSDNWLYVYPVGGARPRQAQTGNMTSNTKCLIEGIWQTAQNGIPVAGQKYIVEADCTIFETDIPPQHMWCPWGSEKYKVLWHQTLKQIVQ
jgi:hypothetical protein